MQRYLEMIYKTIGTDNKLIISESLINNIINVQKSFRTLLVRRRMGYLIMDMNWSKLELKNMSKLKKSYGITNSYMSRMKKQKTDILEFQVPQKVRRLYMYESMRAKRIKYIYDMKVYKKDMIKYEEKMRDQAKQIKILKTLGADNIQLPEIKVPEKPILRSFWSKDELFEMIKDAMGSTRYWDNFIAGEETKSWFKLINEFMSQAHKYAKAEV